MKFSSVEEDEFSIFLLPMSVSLPGGEVGVSASFRMISFSLEAIHGEYLSRTELQRKGLPSCPFCTRHKLAPHMQMRSLHFSYMWGSLRLAPVC